jgi:sporulation protein YlmC with PRC-barrel domain
VEVAAGQDGTRQVEARATTEQPGRTEPTVTVVPPSSQPAAPASTAEAAEPVRADEGPRQRAQRPQTEAPEAQQPAAAPQPRPEQQQQQQQQALTPQPERAERQRQPQAMAPQPERAEPQQQPVQQARAAEEEPAAAAAREAPPAAALTSLETLSDRTVRSSDGEVEGRVVDLIFARETGEIELVIVEYGGFLGLGRKAVAVPWQEVRFDNEAEQLIIDMSRAELQEAPAFDYDALDTERYAQYRR